jgi:hypothetical protein
MGHSAQQVLFSNGPMSEKKGRSDYKRVTSRNYTLATLTCFTSRSSAAAQPFRTRESGLLGGTNRALTTEE